MPARLPVRVLAVLNETNPFDSENLNDTRPTSPSEHAGLVPARLPVGLGYLQFLRNKSA